MSEPSFPSVDVLAQALADVEHPLPTGAVVEAAVLVLLHDNAVLLARRSVHADDPWSGHIGLPGGRHESSDESLLATALRETSEETGIDAGAHVLGTLGVFEGRQRIAGVRIALFVAALPVRPTLTLSAELASAHWIPLAELVTTQIAMPEMHAPVPAYVPAAEGRSLVVWGITYGILERLRGVRVA